MLDIDEALAWPADCAAAADLPVAHWRALREAAACWRVPPLGTVFGRLLNHHDALAALGDAVQQPPYKAPPKAPVLYIKPRNCFVGDGDAIVVPQGADELEIGATLGLAIGRDACHAREDEALSFVAGYAVCNDVGVPHASYYRPSMRFKCRDGFLPVGPWIVAARHVPGPDALGMHVAIDGRTVLRIDRPRLVRGAARLIAEVSEFMTLSAGDLLLLGVPAAAPRARAALACPTAWPRWACSARGSTASSKARSPTIATRPTRASRRPTTTGRCSKLRCSRQIDHHS